MSPVPGGVPTWLRARGWRVGALALAVLVCAVSVRRVLGAPRPLASATYNGDYPVSALVDGDDHREWLLPDGTGGWVDLYLSPHRDVSSLHLVNAKNAPYNDRGVRTMRVEVYFDDDLRQTHALTFDGGTAQDVVVGVPADRIRLVVEAWTGLGGGLAEVEVR